MEGRVVVILELCRSILEGLYHGSSASLLAEGRGSLAASCAECRSAVVQLHTSEG